MNRLVARILLFGIFAVLFGTSMSLQHRQLEEMRQRPDRFLSFIYLPNSDYVKLITLGYDNFSADFLWLRVIQAYAALFSQPEKVEPLFHYFDAMTDLDPHFLAPYSFLPMALGEGAGMDRETLALLDKGIENNPHTYKIAFEAAFYSYWQMDEADLAKAYVGKALLTPDCPAWLGGWLAYFDLKMGRYIAAYETYLRQYMGFVNVGDKDLTEIRYKTLRRTLESWYTAELRTRAVAFFESEGRTPTMEELEQSGAFKDMILPNWEALDLELQLWIVQGEEFPEDPADVKDFANKFMATGWEKMPPNPASDNPRFPGFAIWPGQEPFVEDALGEMHLNEFFCLSELLAADRIVVEYNRTLAEVENYKKEHDGQCPPNLTAANPFFLRYPNDPWGGEFAWDPEECRAYSTSFERRDLEEKYHESHTL